MIELTDEMKQAFEGALANGTTGIVGSASAAGEPDITYKGSLMVFDSERLAYWERALGTAYRNVQENEKVCVLYYDGKNRIAWKFFGRAKAYTEGEIREQVMSRTNQIELDRDPDRKGAAIVIEVDRVLQRGQVLMSRDG